MRLSKKKKKKRREDEQDDGRDSVTFSLLPRTNEAKCAYVIRADVAPVFLPLCLPRSALWQQLGAGLQRREESLLGLVRDAGPGQTSFGGWNPVQDADRRRRRLWYNSTVNSNSADCRIVAARNRVSINSFLSSARCWRG